MAASLFPTLRNLQIQMGQATTETCLSRSFTAMEQLAIPLRSTTFARRSTALLARTWSQFQKWRMGGLPSHGTTGSSAPALISRTVVDARKASVTVLGTSHDDIFIGADVVGVGDTISGAAGNDLLTGASGDDTLSGGNDNDVIYGQKDADTLNGDCRQRHAARWRGR